MTIELPLDEEGLPDVQAFIRALHDAVPEEMVDELAEDMPSPLPPEAARITDRLTIGWAFLADGIAATLIRCYGRPEQGLDAFVDLLRTLLAQRQVEAEKD